MRRRNVPHLAKRLPVVDDARRVIDCAPPRAPVGAREVTAMGFVVKDVQPTPNPNATKFVLDREITDQPLSFLNPDQGKHDPLASKLFAIQGVASVLMLGDFVTVNKESSAKWPAITRKVEEILKNFENGGR
jgi:hypothetical protein